MKILYFSPVAGDGVYYLELIQKMFNKSSIDIDYLIIDYTIEAGQKWQLAQKYIKPENISEYDYIFVWDDDLCLSPNFSLDEYINTIRRYGFDISQPALFRGSYSSHAVTEQQPNWLCRQTNFVEIMCPVFTQKAWCDFYCYLDKQNNSCWGYDYVFNKLGRCGIVDMQAIIHTRPVSARGPQARRERDLFVSKHGLSRITTTIESYPLEEGSL